MPKWWIDQNHYAMSFIPAAEREVANRSIDDPIRITLEFLLANAVGRENAIPITTVIESLELDIEYKDFQQQILGASRHGDYFIGSGTSGIYLIETLEDIEAMQDFYLRKMRTQLQNFNNLATIAERVGWQLPTMEIVTTP